MNEISLDKLPPLGEPLAGGAFAGIVTQPDGAHVAVVLLPERCRDLSHSAAAAWAREMGGQLPTRPIAALLFANAKHMPLPHRWHWCLETEGASYAWICNILNGAQYGALKSFEGSAVAVRLIPVVGGENND